MNISKINLINFTSSKKEIDIPDWVNKGHNKPIKIVQTRPCDEFNTSRPKRSRKRKRNYTPVKYIAIFTASASILLSQVPKVVNNFFNQDKNISATKNPDENADLNEILNDETQTVYIDIPIDEEEQTQTSMPFENGIPNVPIEEADKDVIEDENIVNAIYYGEIKSDINAQAQNLLDDIYERDEYANEHMENLRKSFNNNYSDLEIAQFLVNLCYSKQWADECIDPLTLYAQICQESNCDTNALGDYSKKSKEYLAVGFGQCHECAVDEVNEHIKKGTFGPFTYNNGKDYTYEDRADAKKGLEIMVLYLKYCANRTDSTKAMLAMYNRGTKNGIKTPEGKEYVRAVYSQIGQ